MYAHVCIHTCDMMVHIDIHVQDVTHLLLHSSHVSWDSLIHVTMNHSHVTMVFIYVSVLQCTHTNVCLHIEKKCANT